MRPHAKLRFPLILSLVHVENYPSLCLPVGMQKIGRPQSDVMVRNCVIPLFKDRVSENKPASRQQCVQRFAKIEKEVENERLKKKD